APDMIAISSQGASQQVRVYSAYYQCIVQHQTSCPPIPHNTYFTQYSGGNPNLVPETGKNWSYGIVLDPTPGLTLSVDYVRIELNNIIKDITLDTALTDEAGCRTGLKVGGTPYTDHDPGS